ncbi:hypothetical protein [Mitsuokella sp.]
MSHKRSFSLLREALAHCSFRTFLHMRAAWHDCPTLRVACC